MKPTLMCLFGMLLLYGCAKQDPVKVVGIHNYHPETKPIMTASGSKQSTASPTSKSASQYYTVQRGDTLAAIAHRYHTDVEQLIRANQLSNPNVLQVGQRLEIPRQISVIAQPQPSVKLSQTSLTSTAANTIHWIWPTKGEVVGTYGSNKANVNKGINISGFIGQPIVAAASGKVAFSGNGGPGYGNLIIIQHDDGLLSVYGNLQSVRVQEGKKIRQGQQIATMGKNASKQVELHFEIRQQGNPVNPLKYLSLSKESS